MNDQPQQSALIICIDDDTTSNNQTELSTGNSSVNTPPSPTPSAQSSQSVPECIICMTPIQRDAPNAGTRTLGCNHTFHTECIEQWLNTHSDCPLCRTQVPRNNEISTRTRLSTESALSAVHLGIQQIIGRYVITLFTLTGIFIYEITDIPYTSTYLSMALIGINLIVISLLLPIAKRRLTISPITNLIKVTELMSSFPLARIVICATYFIIRVREMNGIDILAFAVVVSTIVSNVDDAIAISILSPALFTLRTQ